MKKLLLSLTLTTLSLNTFAECSINVKAKTEKASSGTIADVNFSKKQLEALSKICKLQKSLFSTEELIALEKVNFEKKIARLQKGKK